MEQQEVFLQSLRGSAGKCFIDVDDGSIDTNLPHFKNGFDKQFREPYITFTWGACPKGQHGETQNKEQKACSLGTSCTSFLV